MQGVLFKEVSSFQRCPFLRDICMHEFSGVHLNGYNGWEQLSNA